MPLRSGRVTRLADPQAAIVAAVMMFEPGLSPEEIRAAVAVAAFSQHKRRKLALAVVADPDLLVSGRRVRWSSASSSRRSADAAPATSSRRAAPVAGGSCCSPVGVMTVSGSDVDKNPWEMYLTIESAVDAASDHAAIYADINWA